MTKITKTLITKLKKDPLKTLEGMTDPNIVNLIQQANYEYYNSDTPLFSDDIFDMIKEYFEKKSPNHPVLKNIGSIIAPGTKKVKLPYFMGSLDKIKTDEKAHENFRNAYKGSYVISDKLDGNSAMIYIKDAKMQMFSRGDGAVGQDISHLLSFIKNVPPLKSFNNKYDELAVRGELICSKADFEVLSKTKKIANARNMVSGVINAKIPDLEIASRIQFVAYEIVFPKMTPTDQMVTLEKLGFSVVYNITLVEKLDTAKLSEILVKRRNDSPYEIDGIVVIHNAIHPYPTSGNPSYGFAFKSIVTMSKAEVIVTDVEWNLSKDGYLIPTILFNPVNVGGVSISRANGFNAKYILDNVIGPGSKLLMIRSGDVIPYIQECLSPSFNNKPHFPDESIVGKYTWTSTGVDIVVNDKKENSELRLKNLQYFFDKIDVPGLGPGNIKKMFDGGFKTVKAIFEMNLADFLRIDGFKQKSAEKFMLALSEKRNSIDCVTLVVATNTVGRGIGVTKIKLILDAFPQILSMDNFIPTIKELINLQGIEAKTANLVISNLPSYYDFVKENGLDCLQKKLTHTNNKTKNDVSFENEKVILTGFRSKVIEEFITSRGGIMATGISSKVTLVIRKDGEEDSIKVQKAKQFKIKIMDLSEFEKSHNIQH